MQELANHTVPPTELVWQTASTKRYRAFEAGEEVYFYDWRPEEQQRTKVLKETEYVLERQSGDSRDHIEEPYLKDGKIVRERRFIMSPAQVRCDWDMYWARMVERAAELVKPILGEDTNSLFNRTTFK